MGTWRSFGSLAEIDPDSGVDDGGGELLLLQNVTLANL